MELQEFLLPKERILWQGAPRRGLLFTSRDWVLVPFSLLWGGFAIFWEYSVVSMPKAPTVFALFGVPFAAMGAYLIVGRFFFDAWLRSRTSYGVTDRRILINRAAPMAKFTALDLRRLPDVSLTDEGGGYGTIRFGAPISSYGQRRGFGEITPALDATPQFLPSKTPRKSLI